MSSCIMLWGNLSLGDRDNGGMSKEVMEDSHKYLIKLHSKKEPRSKLGSKFRKLLLMGTKLLGLKLPMGSLSGLMLCLVIVPTELLSLIWSKTVNRCYLKQLTTN